MDVHLGLGVFWAVVIPLGIALLIFAILLLDSYCNVNKTKKKVLLEMYKEVLEQTSYAGFFSYRQRNLDLWMRKFKGLFSLLDLEDLENLRITKPDEDIYNMHQDVDDLRREEIEEKKQRRKQAW